MEMDAEKLVDISEKGAVKDGARQTLARRLFMQLRVFGGCGDFSPQIKLLEDSGL